MSVATVCLLMLTLAGCAQPEPDLVSTRSNAAGAESTTTQSPATESSEPTADATQEPSPGTPDQCAQPGAEAIAALAGVQLEPRPHDVNGIPACVWGDLNSTGVQVILVAAELWATQMPAVLEDLLERPEVVEMVAEETLVNIEELMADIEAGEEIDPTRACEIFSLMLVADGQPEDTNYTVRIIPSAADPQGLTAQGCVEGVYASVLLVKPDLTASAEEIEQVGDALLSLLDAY
ncbi:hypothetical protein [Occultella gossypii]|uniref:DUF3558 domain-containing protein n=1 Tax=Occultella gossypii TaxID=2800820 RepID=A0ABS7SGH5_9MICO|nr:hypothetical protein [Occultella gossypii]MBZ2199456.1 hypothetical protein [Occultella gossypii]